MINEESHELGVPTQIVEDLRGRRRLLVNFDGDVVELAFLNRAGRTFATARMEPKKTRITVRNRHGNEQAKLVLFHE